MYDLNSIREITQENLKIYKVGEIDIDLLGTQVTMKDVIIAFDQEELYFIPEIFAHDSPGVDADNIYPLLVHETTNDIKVDYSSPLKMEPSWMWPLAFAVLIYFQDNAKGIRQNSFAKLFKDSVIAKANQS